MAGKEEKSRDFYDVLGLKKECSTSELRNAYKKLALSRETVKKLLLFFASMKPTRKVIHFLKCRCGTRIVALHPAIQNMLKNQRKNSKRYRKPILDMGDFLGEMAAMMSQSKPNENREESLEQLQELFDEMFQLDRDNFGSTSYDGASSFGASSVDFSPLANNDGGSNSGSLKRNSADMTAGRAEDSSGFSAFEGGGGFCFGRESTEEQARGGRGGSKRRSSGGRKQKVSSKQEVSSRGTGISA